MSIASGFEKIKDRILTSAGYKLRSLWTSAQTVEMDDGTYLQDKIESMDAEIDGKAPASHAHPVSQVTGLTGSRALVSDSSGHPAVSAVTSTELGYLDGAKSNIQGQINTLNSNLKKHYVQGGMANTQNANGYFRYCNITFPTKYKTTPNFVAVVMNYQSTAIDARLCTLVKNITTTGAQVFVADSQGQIGNQGYQVQWIAVGEIN